MNKWDEILSTILMQHGLWAVLFIGVLVVSSKWIAKIHKGRLEDRQQEIDRVAAENREYRELFSQLLHDKMLSKDKDKEKKS